jgi:hypothetical protein
MPSIETLKIKERQPASEDGYSEQWDYVLDQIQRPEDTNTYLTFSKMKVRNLLIGLHINERDMVFRRTAAFETCSKYYSHFFEVNVNQLVPKLSGACYAVSSLLHISNTDTLKSIYFAYFHSLMKYGIIFWSNSSDSKKVFTLQKKIVRTMMNHIIMNHIFIIKLHYK